MKRTGEDPVRSSEVFGCESAAGISTATRLEPFAVSRNAATMDAEPAPYDEGTSRSGALTHEGGIGQPRCAD